MPSGNISFTDENVAQKDLQAFTPPEMLEGLNLSSLSDMEKVPFGSWKAFVRLFVFLLKNLFFLVPIYITDSECL